MNLVYLQDLSSSIHKHTHKKFTIQKVKHQADQMQTQCMLKALLKSAQYMSHNLSLCVEYAA